MTKLNPNQGKRPYNWVHPEAKRALLVMVLQQGCKIRHASESLGIHYSNAKMIITRHKAQSSSHIACLRGPKVRQVFKVQRASKPRSRKQHGTMEAETHQPRDPLVTGP